MALHDNIQNSFNIISSTTLGNIPSFMTQASPLQTQILGSMIPQNLQLPDFNTQIQSQNNWSNYQKQQQLDKTGMSVSSQGITTNRGLNGGQIVSSTTRLLNDVALPAISKSNNLANFGNIKNLTTQQATQVGLTPSNDDSIVNQFKDKVTAGAGSSTGGEFKDFMNSGAGTVVGATANLVGGFVNQLGNNVGAYSKRPEAQQLNETQDVVRSAVYAGVSAIPGFGPLISAGLQLTDGLGKMLGTQMSNISKDAAEDAGLSRGFNNVVATIPGLGSVLGAFVKKTDEFKIDRDRLAGVGSGYDMSTFDSAEDLSGGRFVGQGKKVNSFIAKQNKKRDTLTGISDSQILRKMGMSTGAADLAQQNKNRYSGYNAQQFAIGHNGMKFPELDWAKDFLFKYEEGGKVQETKPKRRTLEELKAYADSVNPRFIQRANNPNLTGINFIDDGGNASFGTHYMEVGDDGEGNYYVYPRIQEINGQLQFFKDWREALDAALKNKNYLLFDNLEEADEFATNYKKVYPVFQKFQKGGKLGIDTNIIVEGSYHAHKNHLDEINPELSEMTPKGIPVAAQNEDGSKTQVAEIERKELILTKELTDKIEALYKDGSEEAMIEAGMLFADELFNNTQDNTGEVLNE